MFKKKSWLIIALILVFLFVGCEKKNSTRVVTNKNVTNTVEEKKDSKDKKEKKDISIYKGYKGPVQGEIKYQEGRPAKQNSQNLKASGDIGSPYHVDLIVTKDFGHNKMFSQNVGLVKDEVGMEVLFRNLDIQTAYGGGFVNAINGLESKYTFFSGADRKKEDWFYWVNGILAPVGVAEYRPSDGDAIWWDYHEWNTTMFIPAVIGSYPEPFQHGFWGKNPGTVVMYTDEFKDDAEKLKKSLKEKGVKSIDVVKYDSTKIDKPDKYHILLGKWDDLLKNSKRLKEMNWRNKLEGTYVEFKNGKLNALDNTGKVIKSYDKAGAIYATSSGMGSTVPVWLVTGTDLENVRNALNVLLEKPEKIKNYFGAVVSNEDIVNVPFIQ
ncbi:hypothetical protein BD780_000535 [Clostridium tetanomorphum]|uniref:DUF4430 domain-containing protein n=1 Tax=Clostridium tetanomorphum TaxID=1553 RepID=A0A923J070_CLOTT|nr:DUF4430 domain-containing protein [Clostridium tetanomorphum]KAJ49661.1 hypothetical protein CTM_21918 [Clostridium tetanomorphum DSM 665]MBC2397737.1 DUF4430 domain-containing protein [Clostridium tetanomorphum]MBP1865092.1 hypothetical protein [Clostridium tetanomorphum]NRS83310.1 hypothetical protein [Clostridium tetanomorphum]NRZ96510.1 hypothetical protein [Clostridium tetanomorphum]